MSNGLTDIIADFINSCLNDTDGIVQLQRSELANRFNCVPSQVNYVISTRFSPEHGYIVESKRGGNGYVRITRIRYDTSLLLMHTINSIGYEIDYRTCEAMISNLLNNNVIGEKEARLIMAAISDKSLLPCDYLYRNEVRASVFKNLLISLT